MEDSASQSEVAEPELRRLEFEAFSKNVRLKIYRLLLLVKLPNVSTAQAARSTKTKMKGSESDLSS